MKSLALLTLSLLVSPACYVIGRGAVRESWAALSLAGAALTGVLLSIHYLLGGFL